MGLPSDSDSLTLTRLLINRMDTIDTKLERILAAQVQLESRLSDIEDSVDELQRALKGSGASHGLITDVALLKHESASRGAAPDPPPCLPEPGKGGPLTLPYVFEKFGIPLLLAFLVWVLLTILPNILSFIGSGK